MKNMIYIVIFCDRTRDERREKIVFCLELLLLLCARQYCPLHSFQQVCAVPMMAARVAKEKENGKKLLVLPGYYNFCEMKDAK